MGNTMLAHALFSCEQIDLDLDNFFSNNGDAHAIQKINKSNLVARHLIEYPDSSVTCIAQVVCQDWWEILRIKLVYSKFYKATPTLDNMTVFFPYYVDVEKEQHQAWNQFYSTFKDPTWPECNNISDIANLPVVIQQKVNQAFCMPDISIPQSESRLVEWLAITYYDTFCNPAKIIPHSNVILLGDYIQGNLTNLIEVCESVLKWSWNDRRSQQFHAKMISVNREYIDWLNQFKTAITLDVRHSFKSWEQALAIAKWCADKNQHPKSLNWDSIDCNSNTHNLYLQLLRKNHG